jgi:hypothetical protein
MVPHPIFPVLLELLVPAFPVLFKELLQAQNKPFSCFYKFPLKINNSTSLSSIFPF